MENLSKIDLKGHRKNDRKRSNEMGEKSQQEALTILGAGGSGAGEVPPLKVGVGVGVNPSPREEGKGDEGSTPP